VVRNRSVETGGLWEKIRIFPQKSITQTFGKIIQNLFQKKNMHKISLKPTQWRVTIIGLGII